MKQAGLKLAAAALGVVPLIPGYALTRWPELIQGDAALAGILLGLAVLAYFYLTAKRLEKKLPGWGGVLLLSAFGFVMLVLLVTQEVAVGRYWSGLLGLLPQAYFVPVDGLSARLLAGGTIYGWMAPMTGYFLQVLLTVIGGNVKLLRK